MSGKRNIYYTMIKGNNIVFSGTAYEAVDKRLAKNVRTFRTIIQDKKYFDGEDKINIFVTKKPFDERCIKNMERPICLLSAACDVYTEGNNSPCCKHCEFRKGCRDQCRNKEDKCGCQYIRKNT